MPSSSNLQSIASWCCRMARLLFTSASMCSIRSASEYPHLYTYAGPPTTICQQGPSLFHNSSLPQINRHFLRVGKTVREEAWKTTLAGEVKQEFLKPHLLRRTISTYKPNQTASIVLLSFISVVCVCVFSPCFCMRGAGRCD